MTGIGEPRAVGPAEVKARPATTWPAARFSITAPGARVPCTCDGGPGVESPHGGALGHRRPHCDRCDACEGTGRTVVPAWYGSGDPVPEEAPCSVCRGTGSVREPEYGVVNGWLVEYVGHCNCNGGQAYVSGAHEAGCGTEPIGPVERILEDHAEANRRRAAEVEPADQEEPPF